MEAILKDVQLGLLIRTAFAGIFFVISYRFLGGDGLSLTPEIEPKYFAVELPIAVVAGMAIYQLHRAVVYPRIELRYDKKTSADWECKQICDATVDRLLYFWRLSGKCQEEKKQEVMRRVNGWADSMHFLYSASLCILAGSFIRAITNLNLFTDIYTYLRLSGLLLLAIVFFRSALVSNWRLLSVLWAIRNTTDLSSSAPTHEPDPTPPTVSP